MIRILFILPAVLSASIAIAQNNYFKRNYAFITGVQISKGIQTGYKNDVDYDNKPFLIQLEFQKALIRSENKLLKLDYFVQPQINFVKFRDHINSIPGTEIVNSWETGINVVLILFANFIKQLTPDKQPAIYLLAGSGPHYIHSSPDRQAEGFIFSDNFGLGFKIPFSKHYLFDVRCGIRHLSNASLKQPNDGIDNILIGAGIKYRKLH